jgi:hypothetical protein
MVISEIGPTIEIDRALRKFRTLLAENTDFGFVLRLDFDLRPGGRFGPIVSSLPQVEDYYWSQGETWERLALVRARILQGPPEFCDAIMDIFVRFCYRKFLDYTLLDDLKQLRSRIHQHYHSTNKNEFNIKLGVGGGKDSVVTIEELRKKGAQMTLLRLGHHPLIEKFARTAGLPLINVNRSLSPELFKLNEDGALNGHVPITAYLSCVAIATSILNNMDAVAMSNERSANEGNVEFHGKEINHQWSKSEEFEKLFQNYIHDFVTGTVQYGSQLRDKTELQIVGEFVKYPQYFHCTTSCNTNWRIVKEKPKELWCGKCPKCAFVFALFAAYLPKATVLEIFGKNFFEDATLSSLYKELLGLEGFKPFECVGTPEETTEAFTMAHKKGEWDDGIIMQQFLTSDAHH